MTEEKGNEKPKQKRVYYRKPVEEITEKNYMEFSPKRLYQEIVSLRVALKKRGDDAATLKIIKTKIERAQNTLHECVEKIDS